MEQLEAEASLEALIADLKQQKTLLEEQYSEEIDKQNLISDKVTEFKFTEGELARAEDIMEKLEQRAAEIRHRASADGCCSLSGRGNDSATSPSKAVPYKKLVLASGVGFAVPFLLGLLWEIRTNRVTDSLAIDRFNGLAPVVGELGKVTDFGQQSGLAGEACFPGECGYTPRELVSLKGHPRFAVHRDRQQYVR